MPVAGRIHGERAATLNRAHADLALRTAITMRLSNNSAPGICGSTLDREVNDCTSDTKGSWGLRQHETHSWKMATNLCVRRCLSCERCRYITVSLKHRDCSWYAECDMRRLVGSAEFISVKVRSDSLAPVKRRPLYEPPSKEDNRPPTCRIYIHDPGSRLNTRAMAMPNQRWNDTDHNWHVAYWVHRALSTYANRVQDPREADVIFIAHYFLTDNPPDRPLDFGYPLLWWDLTLRKFGPEGLFLRDKYLLRRWHARPADFVAAPILAACAKARGFLHGARWFVTEPYFANTCGYRYHFDIIAPQVVSSAAWDPTIKAAERPRTRFLTYVGRIGKTYIDPPMTMVRYYMWAALRSHPNVTFLATDYDEAVAPYLRDTTPQTKPCRKCISSCKRCLDPEIAKNPTLGVVPRETSKQAYRSWLTGSILCLVRRQA
jgi:hypothetical protein